MEKKLIDHVQLRDQVVIKNRLVKSAMSEQLADRERNPTRKIFSLYRQWAEGGIGLSITGNVMVDRTALGEPRNVVLDEESDLDRFKQWAEAGTAHQSHIWVQLNHPGKQSPKFISPQPVAPSAVSLGKRFEATFNMPRELSEEEIRGTIRKFAISARLAKQAGFTGVQIHGAHGYLVSQFLSPHHNRRNDAWGGSLENRMRFVTEIYRAIRQEVGDGFPVGIKMNASDFREGGFSPEEAIEVALRLEQEGIDLIEISGGTYENPNMMGGPKTGSKEGYFLEYAARMRKSLKVPLVLTGGFRTGTAMEEAIASGASDMIGLARPLVLEPDFPERVFSNPAHSILLPRLSTGSRSIDSMTMIALTWYEYQMYKLGKGKKIKRTGGEWRSVLLTLWRMGAHGFAKRRV